MVYNTYPFELPPIPFNYNALEPFIDAETVHYHYDRHFRNYVDTLNEILSRYPRMQTLTLEQMLKYFTALPQSVRDDILFNAGGVYNHYFYFQNLAPALDADHYPRGFFLEGINQTFGTFENFKNQFITQAAGIEGSGWTALAFSAQGTLHIVNLTNNETLLGMGAQTVIIADMWEHAYYLKYKNERRNYLENIWNVISFPEI